ncbi:MAG: type II toxin-antitoxin system VapC family toxin [Desulfobacterales bacterium]|nr:type II toxin-antitoxin system VapC family toxin [Desulfobacterales bacterium]
MIIFIDTSALVKRYAKEQGSEKVDELFQKEKDVWISQLSIVELLSALHRKAREKELLPEDVSIARAAFFRDLTRRRIEVVAFNRRIFKDALRLFLKDQLFLYLRTLDAFQVSFADKLNRDKGLDMFVVSDRKFRETLLSIRNYPVLDPEE